MPQVYEMRETHVGDINGYVYAAISSLDTIEMLDWEIALSKCKTKADAIAIPQKFSSLWFGIDLEKPDWPYSGFNRHVCSSRMWEIMQPFCSDTIGWIQLPPTQNGTTVEWGLIFGTPEADISKPLFKIPHFFAAKDPDPVYRWPFCSEELRAALVGAHCIGIDFVAREVEQRVFGQGSPRVPKKEKGAPTK